VYASLASYDEAIAGVPGFLRGQHIMARRRNVRVSIKAEAVTAHHEAGHAVAAAYLEIEFSKVTIVGDAIALGRVIYEDPPDYVLKAEANGTRDDPRYVQWMERSIIVTLAGGIAERRYSPRSKWREGGGHGKGAAPGSDVQTVIRRIEDMHGPSKVADAYHTYLEARAEALVEEYWPKIRTVAKALLRRKEMMADEVFEVMFPESWQNSF
jgi:hypothetical protein